MGKLQNYKYEKVLWFWIALSDISNQLFKSVKFKFIYQLQLASKFAFWKSFVAIPDDVVFGKVNEVPAFILAERHLHVREFDKLLLLIVQ